MKKALLGLALATAISTSAFGYTLSSNSGNYLNVNLESLTTVTGSFESDNKNPVELKERLRYHVSGKAKVDDQYTIGFFGRAENYLNYSKDFSYSSVNLRRAVLSVSKANLGTVSVSFLDQDTTFGNIFLGTATGVLRNFKGSGAYGDVYSERLSRSVKFVSERFGNNVYSVSYSDNLKGNENVYEVDGNVKTTLANKRVLSSSAAFKVVRSNLNKDTSDTSYKTALQLHYTDETVDNIKAEVAGQVAYASDSSKYGLSAIGKLSYKVNNYFKPYTGVGYQFSKSNSTESHVKAGTLGFASDLYSSKLVNVSSYVEGAYENTTLTRTTTKNNVTTTTKSNYNSAKYQAGVNVKF